jgi:hypothetical protein
MRPVERQFQQLSVTPKTQQVSIPTRSAFDQPAKQLSVPKEPVKSSSKSPTATGSPVVKTGLTASKATRQSSPAMTASNPFGDIGDDDTETKNPFGDPDEYDDSLNPFS